MTMNANGQHTDAEIKALEESLVNDPPVPVNERAGDPVARNAKGYWYYDETWSQITGPFETEAIARAELVRYCHYIETGEVLAPQD